MLKNVKLSIIIPVFNGEKYLKDCLKSIYNQYESIPFTFETIIVDDGSTDNSDVIYQKYSSIYKNISYFKNTNHGVSYSRNYGIDKAKGKYLLFVDCDDMLNENWFSKLNLVNDFDYIYMSRYFEDDMKTKANIKRIVSYITTYNNENIRISGPYSKLFRTEFIKNNNIRFDEKIINGEDMLFCLEATVKAKKYLLEKNSIYIVRHNKYSATSNFNGKIINSEMIFNDNIKKVLEPCGFYNEYIEKYSFLTSIRAIAIRLGSLNSIRLSKHYFVEIIKNPFYKYGLKKYKYELNLKKNIFFYLFKYRIHILVYILGKYYNKKNKYEHFEYL